jgi:hypothetical protein
MDFEFEIIDGKSILITGYTGESELSVIPKEIQGLPVTGIGDEAFCGLWRN